MKKKFSFLLAMTFLIQCMSFVYANDVLAEEVETNSTNYFSSKILPVKLNEHVRDEYTAKIYGGSDYIGTTNWSGYR